MPQLDSVLIDLLCKHGPSVPHSRHDPPPSYESLPPIPMCWDMIGGHRVYRCSSPIYRVVEMGEEFCVQAFPKEMADLLLPDKRGVLRLGHGPQKSLRLKYDSMIVSEVVWFASISQRPAQLRKELKKVCHLGSQRKRGRGRIADWSVELIEQDYSWFAPHKSGSVLMRNLPECDELPADLVGGMTEYNACTPPYWHPGRKMNVVVPC